MFKTTQNSALRRYTVLCIETGEKLSVRDIQCCVLKQERNRAWGYKVLCTETGEK